MLILFKIKPGVTILSEFYMVNQELLQTLQGSVKKLYSDIKLSPPYTGGEFLPDSHSR